ncbi:hypothetical protein LCGC14_0562960 [marine sediment metagenome]|uniref:Uroporphyrinogen decarboxylase (URO-D) domain-containing protein n=1 Tax=marine sediment metagenome TaxID=412755 RepID=A0A0F9RRQ6_9ZZZZ|nr:hypothetical protein [Phycisphaerae bacterium]HDZ44651.1 hypothetical protein [Phycisphaerae bacterium]
MTLDSNVQPPRKEVSCRYYRTFTYQDTDRVADIEFGYWPQTVRRWLAEGMDYDVPDDQINGMFGEWMDDHFGFDQLHSHCIYARTHMNPAFEHEVIEQKEHSVIIRNANGVLAEQFNASQDESSIPHFMDFPVKTPDDWAEMKARHRVDDPARTRPGEEIDAIRTAVAENRMIYMPLMGPYAKLRDMMGFMNLSCAFYEYPDMIRDMIDTWTQLQLNEFDQLPDDIPIDQIMWWEDMAGRNGPFVGPDMFREFLQPCYHAVMTEAKKRGCAIGLVDCDGDPHDIVANWMQEGVNIMFPLEVAAGVDMGDWRKEFGMELRIRGGVDKRALTLGRDAIDAELERLKPFMDQGGFIPHLDHLVPPDISYDNYCYYRQQKCKLIGKT